MMVGDGNRGGQRRHVRARQRRRVTVVEATAVDGLLRGQRRAVAQAMAVASEMQLEAAG